MIFIDRFRDGLAVAVARGYQIQPSVTRLDRTKRCCALGAVSVAEGMIEDTFDSIGKRMGLTQAETCCVVEGFDGVDIGTLGGGIDHLAYGIGQELAAEFLP